jgi:hypothetical protein
MDGLADAAGMGGGGGGSAEPKQPSAFQIAVSVAHAADHKVRGGARLCRWAWW